ncbi:MAG TPA: STAS domain-containing protein [Bryobacteraceae bacterium]|nr:STAS domain-containing protein [Bryobacteraceae bacterium]
MASAAKNNGLTEDPTVRIETGDGPANGAQHRPSFEILQRDGIGIVRISGRFATGTDYAFVMEQTRLIKGMNCDKVIADVSEMDSAGSEGIGFFVELHASMARKPGGLFVLAGPAPRVLEVLTLCGLIPIIRITADFDAALALCAAA